MDELFPGINKVQYEGPRTKNQLAFRYYNPDEMIFGCTMREYLRYAVSYWHTFGFIGVDMFGDSTMDKNFGKSDPLEIAYKKVEACFELMDKLSVEFYCFHDRDIAPEAELLEESNKRLDDISDYILKKQIEMGKKCLWGTANLFSNPRYMHGAGTAPNVDVFVFAAGQIKKNIDVCIKLGASGIVFWGGREGYDTLLNTNMDLELRNMARLLRLAVDYARSEGFNGDFYIEPKPKEPTKHQYDFDAATVIGFLYKYNLLDDFKLNIEANHATLAGHTFQHELRVARINGVFGSIDANQGDLLLGWDTDQFPTNVYETTLAMYEVINAGGFKNGGLNFDAKTRRGSNTQEDLFLAYITGMDTFAQGLRAAKALIEDGRVEDFINRRYASWDSDLGKRIQKGDISLNDLAELAVKIGDITNNLSGSQEYLESILNQVIYTI